MKKLRGKVSTKGLLTAKQMHCRHLSLTKQLSKIVMALLTWILLLSFIPSLALADENKVYLYLNQVMDKYHNSFDVYTDANAGGNHYISSGWMGDWGDISFDTNYTINPHSGLTCIRIDYSAQASQGNSWAGIYWQHPQDNWGNKEGGYNLSGFERITFWAKGKKSGEKLEFKVGGITGPYGDSL